MTSRKPQSDSSARTVVTTLLITDLVDSTRLVDRLGDVRAAEVFARQDRLARDLLGLHAGREIDKTDGFLHLFNRPIDAVLYALAYHEALENLSHDAEIELKARIGIHLGEVVMIENSAADVARGAKPVEVEGIAKPMAARIMSLAQGGQTLLTQGAFDLARRAMVGDARTFEKMSWMAHGAYLLKGCEEPVPVFEVGVEDEAPLAPPPDTEKAKRSVAAGDEETLGWRPAAGLAIPDRKGWVLDRKLGEGGFGEVWLAVHQRTKNRRVFKFCFDAERLRSLKRELTLFRLLRDALGDRKDIARLYEVQLEQPPFYLESDFTEGGSLEDWAEAQGGIQNVPLQQRIELVAQTARAVAAAHSVGVLHKDIKPGNILIYEDEHGKTRPRLADFGIGALTDREHLANRNITIVGFTGDLSGDGSERTTTQMYAPPELLAGRPYTVLGDVYALGVLLYQMVVGDLRRPLAFGWEGDVQDPLLREDIAACVQGVEEQRLGSAQGLAGLLERLPERRKASRRRKIVRAFAASSFVFIILAGIASVWALREAHLHAETRKQMIQKEEAEQFLSSMLANANPWDSETFDPRVVDLLDPAAEELDRRFADQPEIRSALQITLGQTYRQLGLYAKASAQIEPANEYFRRTRTPPDRDLARSIHEWAALQYQRGNVEEAGILYPEALEMRRAIARRDAGDNRLQLELAETINHLAEYSIQIGQLDEAERYCREAFTIRSQWLGRDHRDIARSINNLGYIDLLSGRFEESCREFRSALEIFQAVHDGPHLEVAGCMSNLARCLMAQRQFDEARQLLEAAVAMKRDVFSRPKHDESLVLNLRKLDELLGEAPGGNDSVRLAQASEFVRSELLTFDNESIAISLHYLGELLLRMNDPAAAEVELREALRMRRTLLPPGHAKTLETMTLLAVSLTWAGREAEAQVIRDASMQELDDKQRLSDERTRLSLHFAADLYDRIGRPELARRYQSLLTDGRALSSPSSADAKPVPE